MEDAPRELDPGKLADAIEATTAQPLDDPRYGPSFRLVFSDPAASMAAGALRAIADRIEAADKRAAGIRVIWLGAHGRAAIVAAVRFLEERPKRGSSEQEDFDALTGRVSVDIERPASDPSLSAAIELVDESRSMSAYDAARYVFDRYRTSSLDFREALVMALATALSVAEQRRARP